MRGLRSARGLAILRPVSTESGRELKALLRDSVAPLMKREGFARKYNRWFRERDDAIQVIEVQSISMGGSFTVNIGIHRAAAFQLVGWDPPPPAHTVFVGDRLGSVAFGRDTWWPTLPSSGPVVADVIERFALPWLDAHVDPLVCAAELATPGTDAAVLLILGGDTEGAVRVYEAERALVRKARNEAERAEREHFLRFTFQALERAGLAERIRAVD
jgi:hypothetical protein